MVHSTDSFWPLVLTYAAGEISDEEADSWIEFDRGCSQRAANEASEFVFVVGTGTRLSVSAGQRGRFSAHLNNRPPHDARYRMAVHMVIRSTVTRGIVQALSWMSMNKSVDKIKPHDSVDSALSAARQDLEHVNIDWDAVAAWFAQWEAG